MCCTSGQFAGTGEVCRERSNHVHRYLKIPSLERQKRIQYWKLIKILRNNKMDNKIGNTEEFVNFFEKLFSENENPN